MSVRTGIANYSCVAMSAARRRVAGLTESKSKFIVIVFYPTTDTIPQLDNIFKSMKAVIDAYRVVQPFSLSHPLRMKFGTKVMNLDKDFQMVHHHYFSRSYY